MTTNPYATPRNDFPNTMPIMMAVAPAFLNGFVATFLNHSIMDLALFEGTGPIAKLEQFLNKADCVPGVGYFVTGTIRYFLGTAQIVASIAEATFRVMVVFFNPSRNAEQLSMLKTRSVDLFIHGVGNYVHGALVSLSIFSCVVCIPYELCQWPRLSYAGEPARVPSTLQEGYNNLRATAAVWIAYVERNL